MANEVKFNIRLNIDGKDRVEGTEKVPSWVMLV